MSKVFTYYEPVPGLGRDELVMQSWHETWRKNGWEPKVLTRADANRHPLAEQFLKKAKTFPTRNPANYDLVCWLRWLAFAQAGGGLMTDTDCINRSLRPEEIQPGAPKIEEMCRVPCMVSADAAGAAQIVADIMSLVVPRGVTHYSDMTHFQASNYPHQASCRELGHPGWETAGAVHFSRHAIRIWNKQNLTSFPKHQIVRKLIP